MPKNLQGSYYHSLSQSRLRAASQRETIPGRSKSHFDPEGNNPGIWLSDDLSFVVREGYGRERSTEQQDPEIVRLTRDILGKVEGEEAAKGFDTRKVLKPIIVEVGDLDESRLLPHPIFQQQFFWSGDMDWKNVRGLLVPENDEATANVAAEITNEVRKRGAMDIEVRKYDYAEMLRDNPYDEGKEGKVNSVIIKEKEKLLDMKNPRFDPEGRA